MALAWRILEGHKHDISFGRNRRDGSYPLTACAPLVIAAWLASIGTRPSREKYRGRVDQTVDRLRAAGCVFAEDEARLLHDHAATSADLESMVDRRVAGEPLEQILGWALFRGLRIAVEAGVFVPRRRTEFLVELAVTHARPGAVVVDLCCGSGAIGAAIGGAVGDLDLYAVDVDPAAVRCARRNLPPTAHVYQGDLYDSLPVELKQRVDVLAANVPYVPSDEIANMPPEARDHEPRTALDGGADGLDILRRVATAAPAWLKPGGRLLIETSEEQAPAAVDIFARHGLTAWVVSDEERGSTVVIGRRDSVST